MSATLLHKCPHCSVTMWGGMTFVRHLVDEHNMTSVEANQYVDDVYERLLGNYYVAEPADVPPDRLDPAGDQG